MLKIEHLTKIYGDKKAVDGMSIKQNPILCKSKIAYIPDNFQKEQRYLVRYDGAWRK